MTQDHIKQLLQAWASAYGGDQLRRLGYVSTQTLTAGAAVDSTSDVQAVRVEQIVTAMEQGGRWKEGRVLRAEFWLPNLPEAERISKLRRIGVQVSRTSYYAYLRTATAFVEGALHESSTGAVVSPSKVEGAHRSTCTTNGTISSSKALRNLPPSGAETKQRSLPA